VLKKIISLLVAIPLLAVIGYLLFKPVPIKPMKYTIPTNAGYTGVHATNTRLADLKAIKLHGEVGPETIALSPDGKLYIGMFSGNVVRMNADGKGDSALAFTDGRTLGLDFDTHGNIIAADSMRGLLSIDAEGKVTVLVDKFNGEPLLFTDGVVVAKNGKIYFTDASTRFGPEKWGNAMEAGILDLMENSATGRVLEYDPATKATRIVAHGLSFANGITLGQDESSIFVSETGRFRVWKIATTANNLDIQTLDTQSAAQASVLLDNLPGYPDNLTRGTDGKIWLGFVAQRTKALDRLATMPWLRKVVLRLPRTWWPIPKSYGHVIAFTEDGKVVQDLQDPSGAYPETTGATETKDRIYIQSLHSKTLGWLEKK
jgi:sugar lactone lactonase YvrE